MATILTSNYGYMIRKLCRDAEKEINIVAYVFNCNLYKRSDRANLIFIELKKASAGGKSVRVLFDYPRLHKPNYHPIKFFTRRFKEAGFTVRYLASGSTQHSKLLIFDDKIAVVGSHNLTTKSVINKYDLSLVVDESRLVSALIVYYSQLWAMSVGV